MTPNQRRLCIEVLGWSQNQFADFVGRDRATVRRWFTGARQPESEMDEWLLRRAQEMARNPPPGMYATWWWETVEGMDGALRSWFETEMEPETNPQSSEAA